MTPDPLPVALPELPTVAWMYRNGRHLELVEHRNDLLFPKHGEELVRKSDALVVALTALRAQAEEVARLQADAERLDFLERWVAQSRARGFKWDTFTFHAAEGAESVRAQLDEQMEVGMNELRKHDAASKQENRP